MFRDILSSCGLWELGWDPSLDDRRAMDGGLEFPDEGVAVIDLDALFDFENLDPFSGQCAPDAPPGITDIEFALAVYLQYPGPFGVEPARRVGIVAPPTGMPAGGWSLHIQRLVRANLLRRVRMDGGCAQVMLCAEGPRGWTRK